MVPTYAGNATGEHDVMTVGSALVSSSGEYGERCADQRTEPVPRADGHLVALRPELEPHHHTTEPEQAALAQEGLAHLDAVDHRSIAALEIGHQRALGCETDLAVKPGDGRGSDDEVVERMRADGAAIGGGLVKRSGVRPLSDAHPEAADGFGSTAEAVASGLLGASAAWRGRERVVDGRHALGGKVGVHGVVGHKAPGRCIREEVARLRDSSTSGSGRRRGNEGVVVRFLLATRATRVGHRK
jgi:hypothetical protein